MCRPTQAPRLSQLTCHPRETRTRRAPTKSLAELVPFHWRATPRGTLKESLHNGRLESSATGSLETVGGLLSCYAPRLLGYPERVILPPLAPACLNGSLRLGIQSTAQKSHCVVTPLRPSQSFVLKINTQTLLKHWFVSVLDRTLYCPAWRPAHASGHRRPWHHTHTQKNMHTTSSAARNKTHTGPWPRLPRWPPLFAQRRAFCSQHLYTLGAGEAPRNLRPCCP